MGKGNRKYVHIAIGLSVTIICLWLAVPGSGLTAKWDGIKATGHAFHGANYWWLIPLMVLLALFFWVKAYRWKLLLAPIRRFNTYDVVPATMIGFMGNNVLPAHLGEFIRMYVLGRTYRLSNTAVLSSIVLERALDMIGIMFFFVFTMFWVDLPRDFKIGGLVVAAAGVGILVCLVLYVYYTDMVLRIMERIFRFLPEKISRKLSQMIEAGSHGLQTLRSPGRFVYTIFISLVHWLILGVFIQVCFIAFSIKVPFSASFLVLAASMVGVMIPAAPGYWGVIQACFTLALKPFGVPQDAALACSIYYHVSQYVPITVVGLFYMSRMGLHLGELQSEAEAEPLASANASK